jgi:hypothetical protein
MFIDKYLSNFKWQMESQLRKEICKEASFVIRGVNMGRVPPPPPKPQNNRCAYCGVKYNIRETHCNSCGAPL